MGKENHFRQVHQENPPCTAILIRTLCVLNNNYKTNKQQPQKKKTTWLKKNLLLCLGIGLISCRVWSSSSKSFQKIFSPPPICAFLIDEIIQRPSTVIALHSLPQLSPPTRIHRYASIPERNYCSRTQRKREVSFKNSQ